MRSELQDFLMTAGARYSNMLGEQYEAFVDDVLHARHEDALELLLNCVAAKATEADAVIAAL